MRRYFNIFLIKFQISFTYRSVSFVWFLTSLLTPILMLIFWNGAITSQGGTVFGWTYKNFATYYLLIALFSSMLVAHIENDVAKEDIKNGGLTSHLLQPAPYYTKKLLSELPWRITQGLMAIVVIIIVSLFVQGIVEISTSPITLFFALITAILAFFISFTFKMSLGLLAFWLTEIGGVMQIVEIIFIICAGFITPLIFLPKILQNITNILPFPYMVYYPIVSFLGKLDTSSQIQVIGMQLTWLLLFIVLYKFLWSKGRKKFTAIGQ